MTYDEHGAPGPSLGVLRAASANAMGLRLGGMLGPRVQAAAKLEQYYVTAEALGATREEAKAALCGTTAQTERDRDAALRRFKDGSPPMSNDLREMVGHLARSSRFSFADIAGAVEVLSTHIGSNPAFKPWSDAQLTEHLPGLVDMARVGPYRVTAVALGVRQASG